MDKGRHALISEPGQAFDHFLVYIDIVFAGGLNPVQSAQGEGFQEMSNQTFGTRFMQIPPSQAALGDLESHGGSRICAKSQIVAKRREQELERQLRFNCGSWPKD
ncbi:hypothetical protein [Phyllobacterium sp. CL33Tsu]|uniref:hypothetical protein n=1 Tax=Phyllobacterium sp. CL33Tsu TaxID=1798191 RepID=UPI0015877991|nr:hypothetical protein [Phyllobacterium sp. CL33Tsu]